ncbi:MAG: FtsW/RodA/SpoVE family cell cycle protein [Dehalobacterium sp.]|jgi:cell division protein FtsW (lipid II flippase)
MPLLKKYQSPVNIIALINIIAFGLLYFYQEPLNRDILIAGGVVIFIIYLANILVINFKFEDEILFLIVSMLCTLGIIMLFRLDPELGRKQIIWFILGNVVFFIASFIYRKLDFWEHLRYLYPVFYLILFLLTMFFGSQVKGATNWIYIGDFSYQPSEIMKLVFVFFIAAYYAQPDKFAINSLKIFGTKINLASKWVFMGLAYFQMGLLVLQRELGTILVLLLIYLTIVYIYEEDRRFLYLNGALLFLGGIIGVATLHYVQVRIAAWINPWSDIAVKGYQIAQSLFAIGSGGLWGSGLGLGQPHYIPEVHTDFIFSAICEEMGIFGGIAVILLYFILVYRGLKIALGLKNTFHRYIALGISLMFGYQTFIIIGGVIKLIPLTGITLPFISYGGSSLTSSFLALGILQSISSSKFMEEEELYEQDGEKVPDAEAAEKDN